MARYVASHSQLLFRSDKGDGGATRMEILFGPVAFMAVNCASYDEFTVYELTEAEFRDHCGPLFDGSFGGRRAFGIGGARIQGLILAGDYVSAEDDKEFWEPSGLLRFAT
ncbi:hypothetical protein ACFFV7_35870 [Nonomuraea spiralis]|uniref:Uncharacterized protein n=1 Tax=Nonomuraea spiralis TaxID=46182 RepID=A0ABV5IQ04_9ACTN|nr:hypothetical protein [Nonomuraea spiralis]GGT11288.1 hypothetical protein GCM10010176_064860 [Nonomuraea spiralis]